MGILPEPARNSQSSHILNIPHTIGFKAVEIISQVLDAVVSDAAEHLAELNIHKELADAGTHLKGG